MSATERTKLAFAAREKLDQYIEALWDGRSAAAGPLEALYLQRLAVAARLSVLLRSPRAAGAAKEIVRAENRAFSHAFLSTEDGRAARGAFNLLVRAVAALKDFPAEGGSLPVDPKQIVGEPLSMVTFVWDYVQLGFDGCGFNVMCPMSIRTRSVSVRSGEVGFRDRLCELIGQIVRHVEISDTVVEISFDQHYIDLLLAANAAAPEAFTFFDTEGRISAR
jgi:hypothetical protein